MALAVTSGCAKTPPAVDFEAKYEPNIGKTYWLLGSMFETNDRCHRLHVDSRG